MVKKGIKGRGVEMSHQLPEDCQHRHETQCSNSSVIKLVIFCNIALPITLGIEHSLTVHDKIIY